MSLLSGALGKRSREVRLYIILTYAALVLGGLTMIYPFLIMISGSFKSDVDIHDYDIVPAYFYNDRVLFRKFLESKYDESMTLYNLNARQEEYSFRQIEMPALNPRRVTDFKEFLAKVRMPPTWTLLGHAYSVNNRMFPRHARGYRAWMIKKCGGSIETYNRRYGSLAETWLNVQYPPPLSPADRSFKLTGAQLQTAALTYKGLQPARDRVVASVDGKYVEEYLKLKYGKRVDALNRRYGTRHTSYDDIFLTHRAPDGPAREDWLDFVRNELNLQFIQVDAASRPAHAAFLERHYAGNLPALNRAYSSRYASFSQVPFPDDALTTSSRLVDWDLFVRETQTEHLRVTGPDFLWRDFLKSKYGDDLRAVNRAHSADYPSFAAIPMPVKEADFADAMSRKASLRWEFATRNYRHVTQYLLLHGRGIWNTFVFCALSVLAVLIVNPVAAYAMSRFVLPSTYKILLFLLATMAFPPMVTAIPNFLLLKELSMLNTFWALVLPGIVNGYSIFLLKGFFDSIPREMYEASQIDGAGEWTMFWGLTMYLSKPILAVISLAAFNAAYGAFVFAFIVCQDEKMWTLMVWLYQLQQYSHQSVTFAALLVASVPTFMVFLFAQRLIIRGIVVPVEK